MRWFHDRSTLTKLLGSFVLICAFMAVVGLIGLTATQSTRASFQEVSDVRLPSIRALNRTKVAILMYQRDIRSVLLTEDPRAAQTLVANLKPELAVVAQEFKAYADLPANDT